MRFNARFASQRYHQPPPPSPPTLTSPNIYNFLSIYNIKNNNDNNNEKLVLRHEMQMQTQQRTPVSNCETRDETNVSSA